MRELIDYLGLLKHGVAELEFVPTDAGPTRWGLFNDLIALETTAADYVARGVVSVGLQPRNPAADGADVANRFKRVEALAAPTRVANIAFRIYLPDDGESDSTSAACALADRLGAGRIVVWQIADGTCYVIAGVPPFDAPEDFAASMRRFATQIQTDAAKDWPEIIVEPVVDLATRLPIKGKLLRRAPRSEGERLAKLLHRPIPPEVYRELIKRGGLISRLFRGEGSPGFDEHGKELPNTPASFDRAFVDALISNGFTADEVLVDALWNRPGCTSRAGGIDTVRAVVHAASDRVAAHQRRANGPPKAEEDVYDPTVPLRERLRKDYLEWSERTERWSWKIDIDLTTKANKVVQFLIDQGAEFYHFSSSHETVFVVGGTQYIVDSRDPGYKQWFTTNVKMFGPDSPRGKELTGALQVAIQQHDACHEPQFSRWGHFDRVNFRLYLCLDPDHAQIVRISCAGDDGQPRVDVLPNGADDITLRGPLGRDSRFEYRSGVGADGWRIFRDDIHLGQALPKIDQLMSTAFNLVTIVPDHMQRPIKFHRGSPGSGKTFAARDWETVMYGRVYASDYSDKPSLLHAIKLGGPFITQDNVEAATRRKFAQVYLVASTGASHKLRKYYHESMPVVFEPNGTLCLTAVEPMTKTEEIRRTFEFAFDAKHHDNKRPEDEGTRELRLRAVANNMLSSILDMFSTEILPAYRDGEYAKCVEWLQTQYLGSKKAFMGWLAWMLLVVKKVGKHLNEGMIDPYGAFIDYINEQVAHEKAARIEGDTALSCLDQIRNDAAVEASRYINYLRQETPVIVHTVRVTRRPNGSIVIGPLTTADLFKAMSSVSKQYGMKLAYEHGRALGARLTILATDESFKEMGWVREKVAGRAHGNNYRYYYTWTPETPFEAPTAKGPEDDADLM